jgi:hypothetical protein
MDRKRGFARAALLVADDYHVRAAQFRLVVVEVHEPPESLKCP